MKEYICDLCRQPIKKYDIRMGFDIEIDGKKTERVDLHSHCYYAFMEMAREKIIEKN